MELGQIRHVFAPALTPGRLVRRYKRFLAEIELADGQVITAHCPNSGSMLGLLEPGAPVMLSPAADPRRRTRWTWEMVRADGVWAGINTQLPNALVAEAARRRALPLFAEAQEVRREVAVGRGTRFDLLVTTPQGPLYVEVKNVTLVSDGAARFPDAVTARGTKHLEELMRLKAQGAGAAMVYLAQRADARGFAPAADIDPAYAEAWRRARRAGVAMAVVVAEVTPEQVRLSREIALAP